MGIIYLTSQKPDYFGFMRVRRNEGSRGLAFSNILCATCSGVASSLIIRVAGLPPFRCGGFGFAGSVMVKSPKKPNG